MPEMKEIKRSDIEPIRRELEDRINLLIEEYESKAVFSRDELSFWVERTADVKASVKILHFADKVQLID